MTLNLNGHTIRFTGPESIAVSLENGATIKDGRIVGVVWSDSVHPLESCNTGGECPAIAASRLPE